MAKYSLVDIFYPNRAWWNHDAEPNPTEVIANIDAMKTAAAGYAASCLELGDRWPNAIEYDIKELILLIPPTVHFNKKKREWLEESKEQFLLIVAGALRAHGLEKEMWTKLSGRTLKALGMERHSFKHQDKQTDTKQEDDQKPQLEDLLQGQLKTDKAVKIFKLAIGKGMIEMRDAGLKWKRSNALLAYLCGIIYCDDTKYIDKDTKDYYVKKGCKFFPDTELCKLFGLKNLGQSRQQIIGERPPMGYKDVDTLFE